MELLEEFSLKGLIQTQLGSSALISRGFQLHQNPAGLKQMLSGLLARCEREANTAAAADGVHHGQKLQHCTHWHGNSTLCPGTVCKENWHRPELREMLEELKSIKSLRLVVLKLSERACTYFSPSRF